MTNKIDRIPQIFNHQSSIFISGSAGYWVIGDLNLEFVCYLFIGAWNFLYAGAQQLHKRPI